MEKEAAMYLVKFKGIGGNVIECERPFESLSSAEFFVNTVRCFSMYEPWIEEVESGRTV